MHFMYETLTYIWCIFVMKINFSASALYEKTFSLPPTSYQVNFKSGSLELVLLLDMLLKSFIVDCKEYGSY